MSEKILKSGVINLLNLEQLIVISSPEDVVTNMKNCVCDD